MYEKYWGSEGRWGVKEDGWMDTNRTEGKEVSFSAFGDGGYSKKFVFIF